MSALVRVYDLAAEGGTKLPDTRGHFRVREFASKDGAGIVLVSDALASVLEQIRLHFGAPVTINSGYRSEAHNRRVGGSPRSQHRLGQAADIVVRGVSPADVAAYAETLLPHSGGIGRYKTFTHIDVRGNRSRWDG